MNNNEPFYGRDNFNVTTAVMQQFLNIYHNFERRTIMTNIKISTLLSAKEVSEILKIGYVKTLELMKYGKIPAIRLGKTYRTSEEVLAEWIHNNLNY